MARSTEPTDLDFWERVASFRRTVRHHHGRVPPGPGSLGRMDCVGPAFAAMWALGMPCDDFTDYPEQPDPAVLKRALRDRADERPWAEWCRVGRVLVGRGPLVVKPGGGLSFRAVHVAYMGPDRMAATIEEKWRLTSLTEDWVESVWLMRGLRSTS